MEQLLLQIDSPERTYDEFPKPPDYKHIPSIDTTGQIPEYGWSQEDWRLYMDGKHPHISEPHPPQNN